jgi:hypothetical protein
VRRTLVAIAALALVWVSSAAAGGAPVELAVLGTTIWSVSDSGLVAIDTRTGRVVARPTMPYAYPVRIAAGGGAVWVASVPNGYGSGAVTRIDARSRRAATPLRLAREGVFDVCARGGRAWAIVGTRRRRVARLDARGRVRFIGLGSDPAWCAADGAGAWFATADGRLVRIDARTDEVSEVARVPGLGLVAAGGGFVWGTSEQSLVRIDERSGVLTRIRLGGTPFSLGVGRRAVWALVQDAREHTRLVRIDPSNGRVRGGRRLPGTGVSVVETAGALWVGGYDRRQNPVLLRLDPRSLSVSRVVPLL